MQRLEKLKVNIILLITPELKSQEHMILFVFFNSAYDPDESYTVGKNLSLITRLYNWYFLKWLNEKRNIWKLPPPPTKDSFF